MSPPWMPLYVGDYLADTTHLSAAEHGAYLLLIMNYWQKGGLPKDEAILARICRMSSREWGKSRGVLQDLFGGDWTHQRIDFELEKARIKSEARAEYGSRGGKAKALKDNDARIAKAIDLPSENVAKAIASSSQPQSDRLLPEPTTSLRSVDAPAQNPKPEKQKRAKAKTPIAENAQPSDDDKAKANDVGMSAATFRHEWQKFRDHHIKLASQMASWPAAWRTWASGWQDRGGKQFVGVSTAAAAGDISDEVWLTRVKTWVTGGKRDSQWYDFYGPVPGRDGCRVPSHILADFGIPQPLRAEVATLTGPPLPSALPEGRITRLPATDGAEDGSRGIGGLPGLLVDEGRAVRA